MIANAEVTSGFPLTSIMTRVTLATCTVISKDMVTVMLTLIAHASAGDGKELSGIMLCTPIAVVVIRANIILPVNATAIVWDSIGMKTCLATAGGTGRIQTKIKVASVKLLNYNLMT